jgi:SAM-dependent methyltransferase
MAQIVYSPLETSKAHARRFREGFFQKYVHGVGLDVGCGHDPLSAPCYYEGGELLEFKGWPHVEPPTVPGVRRLPTPWDMCHGDGDAHLLAGIPPGTFDYVHSSHLLEHLEDPVRFLRRAFEVLKPGGFLLLLVPHRDRYENRRLLPSRWNGDHKSFWLPEEHDPPHTWGLKQVLELALLEDEIGTCGECYEPSKTARIEYVKTCDEGWEKPPEGQHAGGEYSIEAVVRKL